ncbi:hypothetical protein C8Q79DRAFT_743178 [Trametes meyenii]|nr:hypothetical protein C8Q79DRAFT_743178 [Trametes meyenii]
MVGQGLAAVTTRVVQLAANAITYVQKLTVERTPKVESDSLGPRTSLPETRCGFAVLSAQLLGPCSLTTTCDILCAHVSESMAALQVFRCEDIFSQILGLLEPGPRPADSEPKSKHVLRHVRQTTLARFARVSRAFSGPVLDVLWRTIDNTTDLLAPLPSFSRENHEFIRQINENEWTRFQLYAHRVHEIDTTQDGSLKATVWTSLARWCSRFPLLPNLKRLGLEISHSTPHRLLLLAPSLKEMSLRVVMDATCDACLDMTHTSIEPYFAQVTHLSLMAKPSTSWDRDTTFKYWTFSHLDSLEIGGRKIVKPDKIVALSQFPRLRRLILDYEWEDDVQEEGDNPTSTSTPADTTERPRHAFMALRTLRLAGDLQDLSRLLDMTSFPVLHDLSFQCREYCSRMDHRIDTLLQPVLAAIPQTTRRFHLKLLCDDCEDGHTLDFGGLPGHLRAHTGLEDASFFFSGFLESMSTEDFLHAAAGLWPNLTAFELGVQAQRVEEREMWYKEEGRLARIPALLEFVQNRPGLRRLVLPGIDLHRPLPQGVAVPVWDRGLCELDFSFIPPGVNLFPLALILDRLFPGLCLNDMEYYTSSTSQVTHRVSQLKMLLLALQTGRRHTHRTRLGFLGTF